MAAVEFPSPGFFAAALHALRSADPREETINGVWGNFIDSLSNNLANQFPIAIGGVLPLFRNDLERLQFAAETLVRFDMYEAAEALTNIAIDIGDDDVLLSAASLCGHPGVRTSLKSRISELHDNDVWIQIRLYDHVTPSNEEEKLLYLQCWPEARSLNSPSYLTPVAVLDKSLGEKKILDLSVRLINAGVIIRRLGTEHQIPNWFGPHTIAICRPLTRTRILSKKPDFPERQIIVDPKMENERDYTLLLSQLDQVSLAKLRIQSTTYEDDFSQNLWDPDVYRLGVYKTREVAYLTSASKNTLYNLAKQNLLQPRRVGTTIWSFRDLVAVRTWRYLTAQSKKPIRRKIVPALAQFAGDQTAVKLGVTSSGDVLVDRGAGWENVLTGEQPLDISITDVDDAFRPFELGGSHVPHLLHANPTTQLHPAILHGAPYLKGFRIPALALAQLDQRGGRKAIIGSYPELAEEPIQDTISIGLQLMGAGQK